ncbi:MAG: hypothetical protein SOU50_06630 [Oscillospiraceae bacterium]|nr:hypothetical protein [Oscillospiraceae bacterium]MDY2847878.1 hypothetical protein [Oscillospiraceae bacterium]
MAYGVKLKKLTLNGEYTAESLFEALRDTRFTAGTPSLIKQGDAYLIIIPVTDSRAQVQIIAGGTDGKPSSAVIVRKGRAAGAGNTAAVRSDGKAVNCEVLVDITSEELLSMGL